MKRFFLMCVALLGLWGYVATRTVLGIRSGSIWAH